MSNTRHSKILYVDDDKDDCIFLSDSFAAITSDADFVCVYGGEEALNYLNSSAKEELPGLIILDLNMPRWDGRQILHYIKTNPALANIPVVILSTSENKIDKEVCKRLGATSYLQKPYHYDGYREIVNYCLPLLQLSPSSSVTAPKQGH